MEGDRQRGRPLLAHRINYIDARGVFIELDEQRAVLVLLAELPGLGPAHVVGDRPFLFDLARQRVDDGHLGRLAHVGGLVVGAGAFAEQTGVAVVEADEAHPGRLELAGHVDVMDPRLARGRQGGDVEGRDGEGRLGALFADLARERDEQPGARGAVGGRAAEGGGGPDLGEGLPGRVDAVRVERGEIVGLVAADHDHPGVAREQLHVDRHQALVGEIHRALRLARSDVDDLQLGERGGVGADDGQALAVRVDREDVVEVAFAGRRLERVVRLDRLGALGPGGRGVQDDGGDDGSGGEAGHGPQNYTRLRPRRERGTRRSALALRGWGR